MVSVTKFKPTDEMAWDAYVLSHSEGTVFHLSKWKRVVEESFGHRSAYLLALAGERIVGVLPLFRIRSLVFGDFLVSVPFAELGGPLADSPEIGTLLVNEAIARAEEMRVDYLELKNRESHLGFLTKDLYFNFSREILPEPEENLLAIPRKSRAMVRKGIQSGLTAEFGHHLFADFYEVMARSYHQLGTPIFPRRFFRKFLEVFGEAAQVLLVRSREGVPVAGVLTFFFRDRVMPYFAGSLAEHRRLAPNDFKYWELMKYGCERGYQVFDFGRSKIDTGSFGFKKHWGFEPTPLAYQYHLVKLRELPNLSPANPKYQRKIEMWRRLPFALTKLAGPPLAQYLG